MNLRHYINEAIDDGFKSHVEKLFAAMASDPSDANVEKFRKGVETASLAYEKVEKALEL